MGIAPFNAKHLDWSLKVRREGGREREREGEGEEELQRKGMKNIITIFMLYSTGYLQYLNIQATLPLPLSYTMQPCICIRTFTVSAAAAAYPLVATCVDQRVHNTPSQCVLVTGTHERDASS